MVIVGRNNKMRRTNGVTDHLGNYYPNDREMCAAYGIKQTTYIKRLSRGSTKEEALHRKLELIL